MRLLCVLALALLLALGADCRADGPDYARAALPQARLAGQGQYRWFGLKIYEAKLWVGHAGYVCAAPFVLELRYAASLSGVRIADASIDQIRRIGHGTREQHQRWLERMRALFPDVADGTTLAGVFTPERGVRFYRDGAPLGEVEDPEFARAFAGIWLDPASSAPDLRRALLADAGARE